MKENPPDRDYYQGMYHACTTALVQLTTSYQSREALQSYNELISLTQPHNITQ
jgi:hypothetical protein